MLGLAGSGDIMSNPTATNGGGVGRRTIQSTDLEALFNTSEYFDLSAMSPVQPDKDTSSSNVLPELNFTTGLGEASAPFDRFENIYNFSGVGDGDGGGVGYGPPTVDSGDGVGGEIKYDYALHGIPGDGAFGERGTMGMDSVSDGLKGDQGQGL